MEEIPKPALDDAVVVEPAPPEPPAENAAQDKEVGDFISSHVLEKDTVFFEG